MNKNKMYEDLITKAFNCSRFKDPIGLADAKIYDTANKTEDLFKAKLGVAYALRKIFLDYDNEDNDVSSLMDLCRKALDSQSIKDLGKCVISGLEIYNELSKQTK